MNNIEFIEKLKNIVNNYNTIYMWGCFGQPVTESIIASKTKQYPYWYTESRQKKFRELIGKNYFGFDCVCLIKGVLWGWNGDASKAHGGAGYAINGVPDIDAGGMINVCKNLSTDFSNITPGEAVWMEGHIGVYIGNGQVIESTPSWKDGVQITNLNQRNWLKHGKLPYIEYSQDSVNNTTEITLGVNNMYTVVKGDTLTKIANQFGTSIKAIADANNIEDVNLIITGQKLIIPTKNQVEQPTTKTKVVTANTGLVLRSEARKNSTYIAAYPKGTQVTVITENVGTADGFNWDAVIVNNKKGYMANTYLK